MNSPTAPRRDLILAGSAHNISINEQSSGSTLLLEGLWWIICPDIVSIYQPYSAPPSWTVLLSILCRAFHIPTKTPDSIMAALPSTTSLASTSYTLTTSSPPASATCDKNSMQDIENFVPAAILKEGSVCAFPFPIQLNFTSCCAANQTTYHAGVCYQYCIVDQSTTQSEFSTCINAVGTGQNVSLGISGCKVKSSAGRVVQWKGSLILVGLVIVSFLI